MAAKGGDFSEGDTFVAEGGDFSKGGRMAAKGGDFPKGKGKGKGKGKSRDGSKGKGKGRDASKGKGKGELDDAYFEARGDGWALKYKWCLDAKVAEECPYQFIGKGGPPMQTIYAFDVGDSKESGTDVFFSHEYVQAKDDVDGIATLFYELWWTPLPKPSWWTTKPDQWVYMGRCQWQEGHTFKPCIWGKYGTAIRCLLSI